MNKFWIFICGAAVGGISTIVYTSKVIIPALRKEIRKQIEDEMKADNNVDISDADSIIISEHYGNADDIDSGIVITKNSAKVAEYKSENSAVDYSKYSKSIKAGETGSKQTDISKKESVTESSGMDPYIIDESAYDSYSDYKAKEFEVYSDGIIFDRELDDVLDADPELVFGKTAMDELLNYKKGTSELYIRDDAKKFDYHLTRMDYPFDGPTGEIMPANPDDWRD